MDLLQKDARSSVLQTRALRGGKYVGLPAEIGSVSASAHKDVVDLIAAVDRHDNVLHDKLRSARDSDDVAAAANWDTNQRFALQTVLRDSLNQVKADRAKTEAARQRIFTPPALTEGQHVLAIRESEIRNSVRALSEDQRTRVMDELTNGKQKDVLMALARDPTPLSMNGERARGLYKSFQAQEQASALAALDAESEGHNWRETSLTALLDLVRP